MAKKKAVVHVYTNQPRKTTRRLWNKYVILRRRQLLTEKLSYLAVAWTLCSDVKQWTRAEIRQ